MIKRADESPKQTSRSEPPPHCSRCRRGAVLGNTSFAYPKIGMRYGFDAWAGGTAGTKAAVVYRISRESMWQMELRRPHLAILLKNVFLQELCFDAIRDHENKLADKM